MKLPNKAKNKGNRRDIGKPPGRRIATRGQKNKFSALAIALLCLISLSWLAPAGALARGKRAAPPTSAEVTEKKGNLKELRGQIESLRKGVAASEGQRAGAANQLKEVDQEISVTQRDLHKLETQRDKLREMLKDLATQSRELENRLNGQQAQLEKLVYRQYLQGNPDTLRRLLNGDDPSQMARDAQYIAAIGQARSQLVSEIDASLQHKTALAADTQDRADEMAGIEARQKEQHGKLVAQREQRQVVLDSISARITDQRRAIGNLQRDEKQLSQLIDRLAKIIAAKPVPRRDAPRKQAVQGAERSPPAPEIHNESSPEAAPAGSFAQLKGRLRLPARGVVGAQFGSTRQEGSTWKGLFIRAAAGSDVKVIARGRVVFADWMRGFGNLMIVDHGGSYLSIYGNNDALLKQLGDNVEGGETIASVGNSGGNPESGLYFELRHQGQPLDPLKWVNLK